MKYVLLWWWSSLSFVQELKHENIVALLDFQVCSTTFTVGISIMSGTRWRPEASFYTHTIITPLVVPVSSSLSALTVEQMGCRLFHMTHFCLVRPGLFCFPLLLNKALLRLFRPVFLVSVKTVELSRRLCVDILSAVTWGAPAGKCLNFSPASSV